MPKKQGNKSALGAAVIRSRFKGRNATYDKHGASLVGPAEPTAPA